ncbi:hypothetical protein BDP27DRAFT_1408680 [Rhodocollybia butyracea]|uniref:Uncharacterized protein n=1 Tax=Rhodocollybia butyracea TaxID=206335 RepID=A0A9P5P880_9AGAR|nr:hypothetical protein BDP27DRAFT_1408680 [Rhodocollybia butyracea]
MAAAASCGAIDGMSQRLAETLAETMLRTRKHYIISQYPSGIMARTDFNEEQCTRTKTGTPHPISALRNVAPNVVAIPSLSNTLSYPLRNRSRNFGRNNAPMSKGTPTCHRPEFVSVILSSGVFTLNSVKEAHGGVDFVCNNPDSIIVSSSNTLVVWRQYSA